MSQLSRRPVAGLAALALGIGGSVVAAGAPQVAGAAPAECTANPDKSIHVLSFNDFHGRVESAAKLFTPVEQLRKSVGEDRVLLTSNGDTIGGSTFVSAVANDTPSLDVAMAAGVEASATGNHEYDKEWSDLSGRVVPHVEKAFPYLAANVYDKGTTTVAKPLKPYEIVQKGDVKAAVVGAVTKDLPSLVSPAGIAKLDIGDPVEAVNAVAKQLRDGDESNGEADVVVASIHEGGPNGKGTAEDNAKASPNFSSMLNGLDESVDVVFNGHTHQHYAWSTSKGQPIIQANAYAGELASVELQLSDEGKLCGTEATHVAPAEKADTSLPRIAKINDVVTAAQAVAKEKGSEVIGTAEEAISTPGSGGSGTRDQESPMSNMVAQMFYDVMNDGDEDFIGIQNPGGTRTSFDKGEITYEEAALVLPFANSLYSTELTGAQFVEALNQQWQRDAEGNVPGRPYLALGLSKNVSYTYDESKPEGERITSVHVNGKPIDPEKRYTVGSGSFLITGGDNFRTIGKGQNTRDRGLVDLTAWVDWIKSKKTLAPDYAKRGVAVQGPTELTVDKAGEFTVGKPGETYKGTLDMVLDAEGDKVSPQQPNQRLTAFLGDQQVGTANVTDGQATIGVTIPKGTKAGKATLRFVAEPSKTQVRVPVTVKAAPQKPTPTVRTTAMTAPAAVVGQPANVWGKAEPGSIVRSQVEIAPGKWSTSQVTTANNKGQYVIPLTYGRNNPGTYRWRVRATKPDNSVEFTKPYAQPRYALPVARTAGVKRAGDTTNTWGHLGVRKPVKVFTQVQLPDGRWSTSQTRMADNNGRYVVELTYGKHNKGTYRYRVGALYPGVAWVVYSKPFTLVRK